MALDIKLVYFRSFSLVVRASKLTANVRPEAVNLCLVWPDHPEPVVLITVDKFGPVAGSPSTVAPFQ